MDAAQHPATINIKGGITVYLTSCLKGWMDGGKDNVKQVGRSTCACMSVSQLFIPHFKYMYILQIIEDIWMHPLILIIHVHNECTMQYAQNILLNAHTPLSPSPSLSLSLSPSPSSLSLRLSTSMGNTILDMLFTNCLLATSSSALFLKLSELSLDNSSESSASFLRKFFCRTLLILCSR